MKNNISVNRVIDPAYLNPNQYFESLVAEAYRVGLLLDSDLQQIHEQSILQLAKEVKRYTFGDSDSVPVETAQSIMDSVYYRIGIFLHGLGFPELAVDAVKQYSISELLEKGKREIKKKKGHAAILYAAVQKTALKTQNVFYNDTVSGLQDFFRNYDIDFAAHESQGMIDYYLSRDAKGTGVEFMCAYLFNLLLENRFCRYFEEQQIEFLLRGYDENYRDSIINLFEQVLISAVGCILCGKKARQLDIDENDRAILYGILAQLNQKQREQQMDEVCGKICSEFEITDQSMEAYIKEALGKISGWIDNALNNNSISALFVSLRKEDDSNRVRFEDGTKMEDEDFRDLLDEINTCVQIEEKLALIHQRIHSSADMADLLAAESLYEEEFFHLFCSLSDVELAVLISKISEDPDQFHLTQGEKERQDNLYDYLHLIDDSREKTIRDLSKRLS